VSTSSKPRTSIQDVNAWLAEHHDGVVGDVTPLAGRFWSKADNLAAIAAVAAFADRTPARGPAPR
jgi:hypothetical protein